LKKQIIILGILIAVLLFGAPYYTGKVAEAETLKLLDNMNLLSSEYGSTEVLNYERGVRSTSARYQYTPPIGFAAMAKEFGDIIYACESSHGITGIDFTCSLEGDSIYSKFVAESLEGKDPISVFGSISIFGGISQSISLDEINALEVDGATLNFPEALITVSTDAKASEFRVSGRSNAFVMEGNGEQLSAGKTVLEGDFSQVVGSLFTGNMLIKVDHFTTSGSQGETSVKGLSILSNAADQGGTLSSELLFSVDQLVSSSAPFESIQEIHLGLDFKGLDKQSVIEYQEFTQQLQRQTLSTLENHNSAQTAPPEMATLMPILEGMLKQGLEINANINAKLDGKTNKVALDIKLLEPLTIAQLSRFISDPHDALQKIDVSLNASLDKGLLDSQPMVAALIARSPLIAASGDDYVLDLKIGNKTELNGKSMSFVELQTLVFSSLPF
jgi:uncharacterized protein YdgA (DUF945 family)